MEQASTYVTIIGFIFTIYQVIKTKKAAKETYSKVNKMYEKITSINLATEIGSAISIMDEIPKLLKDELYDYIPDRCLALRKKLISIKTNERINEEQEATLRKTILLFRRIQEKVNKNNKIDSTALQNFIKKALEQNDITQETLTIIQNEIGKNNVNHRSTF